MKKINIGLCLGISISTYIIEMEGQYIIKKNTKHIHICLVFLKIIIIWNT